LLTLVVALILAVTIFLILNEDKRGKLIQMYGVNIVYNFPIVVINIFKNE
jgi:hypothetical protein